MTLPFTPKTRAALALSCFFIACHPDDATQLAAVTTALGDEATQGSWSAPIPWGFVAIHTHVLPNGKVLSWGRTENTHQTDTASVWDPATGTLSPSRNEHTNLFCSGHSFLPDGRLLVTGGHIHDGEGPADTNIYDFRTNRWSMAPPMNAGRWYPTNVTLGTGEVLVTAGTTMPGQINTLPQVFTRQGAWRNLSTAERAQPYYPFMHLAPNGSVFYAGPEVLTATLYTQGSGAWVPTAVRTENRGRTYGSSVMYDTGKILTLGGQDETAIIQSSAEIIDLNVAVPAWTRTQPMNRARWFQNATVLPNGTVLVTGGLGPNGPVYAAELWNPQTGKWTLLASNAVPRLYHSTSVLLPDGRVLSGGGGQPGVAGYGDYPNVEVFSPPYLFQGARPQITDAPGTVTYGQPFAVTVDSTANVARVTWVRLGSTTHAFDMNQRFLELPWTRSTATSLQVSAPASSNHAPPGHYMMFVVTPQGVPSTARIVQVSGPLQPEPVAPKERMGPDMLLFTSTNNVVCPDAGGTLHARCSSLGLGQAFRFTTLQPSSNLVALRAPNGQYVAAEGGGGSVLVANRAAIGQWEVFQRIPVGTDGQFALRTLSGHYVSAELGGGAELTANRTAIGAWELFREVSVSPVALQTVNNQYVCAEAAGAAPLVANRTAVAAWETFRLLNFGSGRVALQAVNERYVAAENGGGSTLIANRTAVGPWEMFTVQPQGNTFGLQVSNGQFTCAELGGGGAVVANRPSIGPWETFRWVCQGGLSACNNDCVDTRSNPSHCGGCGLRCSATQTCVDSTCR